MACTFFVETVTATYAARTRAAADKAAAALSRNLIGDVYVYRERPAYGSPEREDLARYLNGAIVA